MFHDIFHVLVDSFLQCTSAGTHIFIFLFPSLNMPSRIDTTTRYHIASRDSEESDRESSPHEHLLSPSPTRSYTRAQSHWYDLITIEVEYFLRFAAIPLAIAAFALFLNDGRPDYTGADIFAMFM